MVETGLNRHDLGKLILAACFVTDLGTVLALGGLFASYGWLLLVFVAVRAVTVALLPRLLRLAIRHFGQRISEPEIKLLLVVLFALGGLATQVGSEAVLPAYIAGLVVAGVFLPDRVLMDRLRAIAFAVLTPFFFLRAGTLIAAPELLRGAGIIAALLLVKLVAKLAGVWPVATAFKLPARERAYTTLLAGERLAWEGRAWHRRRAGARGVPPGPGTGRRAVPVAQRHRDADHDHRHQEPGQHRVPRAHAQVGLAYLVPAAVRPVPRPLDGPARPGPQGRPHRHRLAGRQLGERDEQGSQFRVGTGQPVLDRVQALLLPSAEAHRRPSTVCRRPPDAGKGVLEATTQHAALREPHRDAPRIPAVSNSGALFGANLPASPEA